MVKRVQGLDFLYPAAGVVMLLSAEIMRLILGACLLGMTLLSAGFLRQRRLSTGGYMAWGLLVLCVPLVGPFLVILLHPGQPAEDALRLPEWRGLSGLMEGIASLRRNLSRKSRGAARLEWSIIRPRREEGRQLWQTFACSLERLIYPSRHRRKNRSTRHEGF